MPTTRKGRSNLHVREIRSSLRREYGAHREARVDVYRYNAGSIRVRIIDPQFEGRGRAERDELVRAVLRNHLDQDTREEINLLLLLTPDESKNLLMNLEFDDPTPSRL